MVSKRRGLRLRLHPLVSIEANTRATTYGANGGSACP